MSKYRVIFLLLEKIFGTGKWSNNSSKPEEVLFYCPKCQHHKRKLAINLKNRRLHCWVCGLKSRDYIKFIKENNYGSDVIKQISNSLKDISQYETIEVKEEIPEKEPELALPKTYKSFFDPSAKHELTYHSSKRYLIKKRYIYKEDVEIYQIGFDTYRRRVIIPSFDIYQNLNYYVARNIEDRSLLKYENPQVEKSNIIFNEHLIDWDIKNIFIVEGVFDAMKLNYCDNNVVVSLGSFIKENTKLFNTILDFNNIYLCYDKDAQSKSIRLASMFSQYGKDVYLMDWSQPALVGVKDLGDLKMWVEKPLDLNYKKFHALMAMEHMRDN